MEEISKSKTALTKKITTSKLARQKVSVDKSRMILGLKKNWTVSCLKYLFHQNICEE